MVAGAGIEPAIRGFSIQLNIMADSAVSLTITTAFTKNHATVFSNPNLYVEP